ncbi:hypothetical protein R1flu_011313 [Riccia fluitans]|uniref:Uncharacterized protein n=1 Tax=Riccia fluitans TaxID=41844 RepID=A0ABD1Z7T8_9MARC
MSHSPNLDKLDQEASMQNIDRFVEALKMEAKESRMSKRRKLFLDEASSSALQVYQPPNQEEPSTSAVQVYQPLDREEPSTSAVQVYQPLERLIVPFFPNFGITLKELSMLSRTRSLGHDRNDKFSGGKFREGWKAIVRIVTVDFLVKQATARHEPLLLKARNAFTNTKVEWDSEKGELVHEREALKEELNKAKEMAAKVEWHTEVVRLEKEALQQ